MTTKEVKNFAADIRIHTLRALASCGRGHVGGCMSIADLIAVLYGKIMRVDPNNPDWEDRDWLVLSKGHNGTAVFAALALKGFFDVSLLDTLNADGTSLPSHANRTKTPGVDESTGSLGQGLSLAAGVALGNKMKGKDSYVYCVVGDGESQEGQIWEAVMFAAQFGLDHLICFVDDNKQQIDGYTKDVMNMEDFCAKYESFNWHAQKVDGHDVEAIEKAILCAKEVNGRPSVIVLETLKGKGYKPAEGRLCHHMEISQEDYQKAAEELEAGKQ